MEMGDFGETAIRGIWLNLPISVLAVLLDRQTWLNFYNMNLAVF